MAPSTRSTVRSSMIYQILLYTNGWYYCLFFIGEILLFVYKGELLPYPSFNLAAECVLLVIVCGVEAVRNFFGQKGNLTEQLMPVVFSIVLTFPVLITMIYFLLWQTYVLRLEVILISIQLFFLTAELIFGIVAIAGFAKAGPI